MKHLLFTLTLAATVSAAFGQQDKLSEAVQKDRERGIVLPKTDHHYKKTHRYIEDEPDADYLHASEAAYDAFRDVKFAVRIHWGIYSVWEMNGESWGYLGMSAKRKMEYNELYKSFNPTDFNAQEWMNFFKRSGIKAFAFTTKHHEGFSMFHTKTRVRQRANYLDSVNVIEQCDLAYSIEETPFKRDIVKELCDAAHKSNIKIDLYFSHPDWYDADFRPDNYHPLSTKRYQLNNGDYGYDMKLNENVVITPEPTAEERARLVARHREQLRELLTNYGKIDMICLDQWMGGDIWKEIKETVKMMRKLQPDVMIRCRGIGNYGDYYTPEGFVPGALENTNMPWMTIRALGSSFSYDREANNYKGAKWIIHNLIDAVSKGGNFMVGIGPDGTGKFHPKAIEQLEEVGEWLRVNGEGIYGTRAREVWQDGKFNFTQTGDGRQIFAFTEELTGNELLIHTVTPSKNSKIYMLGYSKPLSWTQIEDGIRIEIPDELHSAKTRPCRYAWGFKIQQTPQKKN